MDYVHKESSAAAAAASIDTREEKQPQTRTAQRWYRKCKLRPHAKTNMTSICAAPTGVKTFDASKIQPKSCRTEDECVCGLRSPTDPSCFLTLRLHNVLTDRIWLLSGMCVEDEACARTHTQTHRQAGWQEVECLTHQWVKAALARPGRQQKTWSPWRESSAGAVWSHLYVYADAM